MTFEMGTFLNLRVTVSFRECFTSWGAKERVVKGGRKRWLELSPLVTRVPLHISYRSRSPLRGLAAVAANLGGSLVPVL